MHRVEKWETNVHVFTKILFFWPNNVKFNAFFPSNNLSLLSKLCEFIVNENSNFLVTNSYIHTSYILCTRWLYMFIFSLRIKCKFVYVLVIFSMNLRDKINCCLTVQTIYNLLLIYITNAFIPQIVWNEFTARCFQIIHCTCTFIKYHRHSKNIYLPFVLLSVTSLRSFEPFSWIIISETKKNIWNKFHGAEMLVDVNKLFVCCS